MEQAELWGGKANEPFDPNYHKATDTLDHIDRTALEINGGGVAYAVGHLRAGSERPQRRSDPRRPHPARADRVMRPSGAALARAAVVVAAAGGVFVGPSAAAPDLRPRPRGQGHRRRHVRRTCASCRRSPTPTTARRAEGTPGYDASVDYVVKTLRDKGFDVQTPEFERLGVARPGNPTLTVSGRGYPVDQASLLSHHPAGRA